RPSPTSFPYPTLFRSLRAHTRDRHRQVDDMPFGGGPGMVMKPEPVIEAVEAIRVTNHGPVILMEPWGERLDQKVAGQLAMEPGLDRKSTRLNSSHEWI